jgi:tetratricopeptide (TPR) repeat protein
MTDANDAAFAEGPARPVAAPTIQAVPPEKEDDSRIPLPPLPAATGSTRGPEQLRKEIARLDLALAGIALVLAFLLASFAARNSDLWLRLARGRLYAHGTFLLNSDPYTYTTGANGWVNHSWLYDLALYALATIAGGAATPVGGAVLVVAKALVVTFLAWVMLAIRRPGQSLWAPAACAGLALLVVSPRLSYHPWIVSYLFLGLTLYMLVRPQLQQPQPARLAQPRRSPLAVYWFLPLLFVLWVNLDRWFFLGPLAVALFLVGEGVQRLVNPVRTGPDAPEPRQLVRLALVLVVGLAACLISPYGYRAFTLPAELSWKTPFGLLAQDPTFRFMFLSPFQPEYRQYRHLGLNVAGMAYYLLVAASLGSFALSLKGWRWWRFTVWLGFAILSGLQLHLVPFFAIVAGPIMALNLQDLSVRWAGAATRVEPLWKLWSLGGRIATLALGVLLLLGTWPGWLHGRPDDVSPGHRVAWRVDIAPGLRQAAEQLKAWHGAGILTPNGHGFNFGPDITNYCAWFCADDKTFLPLEPGFLDYRLEAFPEKVVKEYLETRQALDPLGTSGASAPPVDWPEIFRSHGINHLVLNEVDRAEPPDRFPFPLIWLSLMGRPDRWKLVFLDEGRTSIFLWEDPGAPADSGPPLPRFDPRPLAFGPQAVQAPAAGPGRGPQPRDLWERYLRGPAEPAAESQLVHRYLGYYNLVRPIWLSSALPATEFAAWTGTLAQVPLTPGTALVSVPGTSVLTSAVLRAMFRMAEAGDPKAFDYFLRDKDVGPTAALFLGVRAARQAIADSPDALSAPYASLADIYQQLWDRVEQHWQRANLRASPAGQRHPRELLRQVQVVTALESALKVQPHDETVHRLLYTVYLRSQFLDLALEHEQEIVTLMKASGPQAAETRDDFNRRLAAEEKRLKDLDTLVNRRETDFELKGANLPLLYRAQLAQRSGLARAALDLLLKARPEEMDPVTAEMQLQLLLLTGGHLDPQVEFLDRLEAFRDRPGMLLERYGLLYDASLGNYEKAGAALEDAIAQMERNYMERMLGALQINTFIYPGPAGMQQFNNIFEDVRLTADHRVLRGMLALEQGDTATAARFFDRALHMGDGQPLDFESRPIALHYLELLERAGTVISHWTNDQ